MMNQAEINKLFARGEGILMEAKIRQQALDRGYDPSGTVEEVLRQFIEPMNDAMRVRADFINCPTEAMPFLFHNQAMAGCWMDERAGSYIHPGTSPTIPLDELVGICNQWLKRQNIAKTGTAEIRTDKWGMMLALEDHGIRVRDGKTALIRHPGKTRQALEYCSEPGTFGDW